MMIRILIDFIFAVIFLLVFGEQSISGRTNEFMLDILLIYLAYFICSFFHELGHMIAMKLRGYDCRAIKIGPFLWDGVNKKFKITIKPNLLCDMYAPAVVDKVKSEEGYEYFIRAYTLSLLMGIIANIIFSGILIFVNIYITNSIFIKMMLFFNVTTVILAMTEGQDGHKFCKIKKSSEEAIPYLLYDMLVSGDINEFCLDKAEKYVYSHINNRKNVLNIKALTFLLNIKSVAKKDVSDIVMYADKIHEEVENMKMSVKTESYIFLKEMNRLADTQYNIPQQYKRIKFKSPKEIL